MKNSFACSMAGVVGLLFLTTIDGAFYRFLFLTPVTLCFVGAFICSAIEESSRK